MSMNIAALLAERRDLMDRKSAHESDAKHFAQQIEAIDKQIIDYSESTGLDKISGGGLSITIKSKEYPSYDPERWGDILEWIAANKRYDMVQRRLNTKPIIDQIDAGEGLPPGVGIVTEPRVHATRTK